MRRSRVLCTLLSIAAAAVSQQPVPGPVQPPPTAPVQGSSGRSSADVHTESRSRELFQSCDADSDDRLDLFEACEALETLGDPRDSSPFQRLDKDRDGYLGWPEFDQFFRTVVQRGGTFRVRTCRRLVAPTTGRQSLLPATPLQQFLQNLDQNHNEGLDPQEIDQLVRDAGLPPSLGIEMKALDLDQSGRIEETELAPMFEKLRTRLPLPGTTPAKPASPLPPEWAVADDNGDGAIDLEELTRALRRLDPTLARWARQLLQPLDADRNGRLTPGELPGVGTRPPTRS